MPHFSKIHNVVGAVGECTEREGECPAAMLSNYTKIPAEFCSL